MDIPHTRTHTEVEPGGFQGGEHLHIGAGRLDGGDIRIQVDDRLDQLIELGVAHVGVDLDMVGGCGRRQAEGADRPPGVGLLLGPAQGQQLADGGLIHLDDLRAGVHQVGDLLTQCQGDLVGGDRQGLIITDKRPGQDGHRTGEHALDRPVGQALGVGEPPHRHRLRAGDGAEQDRRTHTAGTITLDPAVAGGEEPVEKLREVLHHVIAFRFTVDQHIQAEILLGLDHLGDLIAHRVLILLNGEVPGAVTGACGPDLTGLREGPDRGGRQRRQVQGLVLGCCAYIEGGAGAVGIGDVGIPRGGEHRVATVRERGGCGVEKRLVDLARQRIGQRDHLPDLLLAEGEPLAHLRVEPGLGGEGIGDMQQRTRGAHRNGAACLESTQGAQGRAQVGAPHIAAIDDAGDQQFLALPGLQRGDAIGDEIHADRAQTEAGQGGHRLITGTEIGVDEHPTPCGQAGISCAHPLQHLRCDIGDQ